MTKLSLILAILFLSGCATIPLNKLEPTVIVKAKSNKTLYVTSRD